MGPRGGGGGGAREFFLMFFINRTADAEARRDGNAGTGEVVPRGGGGGSGKDLTWIFDISSASRIVSTFVSRG